nr:MAG TPA: hypothetical protein [Caudoviricetes sp.]
MPLVAIFDKPLKARTVIGLARNRTIYIFIHHDKSVFQGKLMALSKLSFDGFFSLIVARIPSIDYRFDSLTSNASFLLSNSIGTILDCRS